MRTESFNNQHRYTRKKGAEEEHDLNCECGRCLSFVEFMQERLYGKKGLTNRGIATTPGIEITTREGK
jgi:hypothetical protein